MIARTPVWAALVATFIGLAATPKPRPLTWLVSGGGPCK